MAGVLALAPLGVIDADSVVGVVPGGVAVVAVCEVALSVVLSVMPVVRSLQALLWFTSLMWLMLLVVRVGLCVGGQWLVFGGVQ